MSKEPHLRYLEEVVWRPGGPLLTSLAQVLGEPAPRLKARQAKPSPQDIRELQDAIQRGIDKLDVVMGDADLEPEETEADADFEPSLG